VAHVKFLQNKMATGIGLYNQQIRDYLISVVENLVLCGVGIVFIFYLSTFQLILVQFPLKSVS
jgi:hypothetical protein